MFFGLTNSPATFQTMMDDIFKDEVATGEVIIYMDDILIATDGSLEFHKKYVAHVLSKLLSISLWQIYDNVVNEGLSIVHIALGHLPQYCDNKC
jgi:hypothetical protein